MADSGRPFRTPESIKAELVTRDKIPQFLKRRGFMNVVESRVARGSSITQTLTAQDPDGRPVNVHVRLCWRRDGRNPRDRLYSAAQLRARLRKGGWEHTLEFISEQDEAHGITHTLIAQYDQADFILAALIPRAQLTPIWVAQRDISAKLIRNGKMGRIKKNHAENGASPTIWLQDDRTPDAHEVADALWSWSGVVDLVSLPVVGDQIAQTDDTYDDCPIDYSQLGRDGGAKIEQRKSGYARDPKVRAAVIRRAKGVCERDGCPERRDYPGFFDVHHILGIGTSDRVWNCVALCPNCHREAHYAPEHDAINSRLGVYASRFR